jgi:ABC-type lipoprotein export system ATPase subunit
VEIFPILINSVIFTFIIYYISGQFEDGLRIYKFFYVISASLLCSQALGTSIGIIFVNNKKLALVIAIATFSSLIFFSNFVIPTKELIGMAKKISDFAYTKYQFNSILIIIYGFNRCPTGQMSKVLYQYGINDDQLFWTNAQYLTFIYLFCKSLEFIALITRANKFSIKICCKARELKPLEKNFSNNTKNDFKIEQQVTNSNGVFNGVFTNSITPEDKRIAIAWIDLSFTIPSKLFKKSITILDTISGGVEFGSLNALMGPSGSGKTTLLRCLNGRNKFGLSKETKFYLSSGEKIRTCFITQNTGEHLLEGLTVRQNLIYASKLKNSNKPMELNHQNIINDLLHELMISDIIDNRIEKCSGGERKRIVIASELTSFIKPNLLFMDESTSGLDSNSAEVVSFGILRNFSQYPKGLIMIFF